MFTLSRIPHIYLISAFILLLLPLRTHAGLDAPHNNETGTGCLSCHQMNSTYPKLLPPLNHTPIPGDLDDTASNDLCWSCHIGSTAPYFVATHSSLTTSTNYGNWSVECWVCHNQHNQEQDGTYGKFIRRTINLANIKGGDGNTFIDKNNVIKAGSKAVIFKGQTGANSFADGDSAYDGICEVCHTQTKYFRNDGEGSIDQNHDGKHGTNCMLCHSHNNGFIFGADHSFIADDNQTGQPATVCSGCHTGYAATPETAHSSCQACHTAAIPTLAASTFPSANGQPDWDGAGGVTMIDNLNANGYNTAARLLDSGGNDIKNSAFIDIKCGFCHVAKPGALASSNHGSHAASHFAWSGNCADCHSAAPGAPTEEVVKDIHGNTCDLCHTGGVYNAATNGVGPAAAANGIDGDAGLAEGDAGTWAATCTTCHAIGGGSVDAVSIGSIHHDNATITVANGLTDNGTICATCHGVANHYGNHGARVANEADGCDQCHAGTSGSATGIPVNAADMKIHDTCGTCHYIDTDDRVKLNVAPGTKGVTTMNDATPLITNDGGGTCSQCHTAYGFLNHTHDHSLTVTAVAPCNSCHTGNTVTSALTHNSTCADCHNTTSGARVNGAANTGSYGGIVVNVGDATVNGGNGGTCAQCHTTYFAAHTHNHTFTATPDCATCHGNPSPVTSDARDAIAAPFTGAGEVHGSLGCATCHNIAVDGGLQGSAVGKEAATGCIDCHSGWAAIHSASGNMDHSTSLVTDSGNCSSCHTTTTSPYIGEVHTACTTCHTGADNGGLVAAPAKAPGLAAGGGDCDTCHSLGWQGTHEDSAKIDHSQEVTNLATCTTSCHTATGGFGLSQITSLVDGATGNKVHSFCTDCHNANGSLDTTKNGVDPVFGTMAAGNCGQCHTATYFDSHNHHYGPANQLNYNPAVDLAQEAPGTPCASCHTNNEDAAGTPLDSFADILGEHVTGCGRCHSYTDDGQGTPPQAANDTAISTDGARSCASCHTPKLTPATHGCTTCHSIPQGNRVAVMGQFAGNSHHIQGVAVDNTHCYQCHWEADAEGGMTSYHQGTPGGIVDLVVYGAGIRPVSYSGTTAVTYTADGSRTQILDLNTHCVGCHDDDSKSIDIFGDTRSSDAYSWDGTSVKARYSQTGTTTWGKYSGTLYASKQISKSYSAHGNAGGNARGWDTTNGVDGAISNTSGSTNVACYDCHNSHGSTVNGQTTSYASATTNGGILKDTAAGKGGYAMTYKPQTGGSSATKNAYNPGAALCFDCHLNAAADTTPWGYQGTFGTTQKIMGYWDSEYFGPGAFGSQTRYLYKTGASHQGGHFGASSGMASTPARGIGGLCTPCHDPHGVSPTLGANQQYAVPLLKGTWVTSPYKEDAAPALNNSETVHQVNGGNVYHIDQNTFGAELNSSVTGVTQTDTQFAGLCLGCHQKSSLISGGNGGTWKSVDRIHESVKGWGANAKHKYTCSKCHTPHNSRLPRLMTTNCFDAQHKGRMGYNPSPVISGLSGDKCRNGGECYDVVGSGSGHRPGTGGGNGEGRYDSGSYSYSVTCHENKSADQSWNSKTSWVDYAPSITSGPSVSTDAIGTNVRALITWTTNLASDSVVEYGSSLPYSETVQYPAQVTSHSIQLENLNNHSTYYYAVSSTAATGTGTSGERSFSISLPPSVPVLQDEPDTLCAEACSVQLNWSSSTDPDGGPVYYEVQLADNVWFSGSGSYILHTLSWQSGTSLTTPSLAANKTWRWRVRARDNNYSEAVSSWSAIDAFALVKPPSAPTLEDEPSITSGAANSSIILTSNYSAIPDGHAGQYYFQVARNTSFSPEYTNSGWLANNIRSWTVSLPSGYTYYWRVKVRDSVHTFAESAWSAYDAFTITYAATPSTPAPVYPTSVYEWSCSAPTSTYLSWNGDADNQFQVTITNKAGTTHNSGWQVANRKYWWTPNLNLSNRWYWQVQAKNPTSGQVSSWSSEVSYTYQEVTCDSGSCPMLFTWDGAEFVYESDMFGTGKLGLPKGATSYIKPNPHDYYMLATEPGMENGFLELRMVEERAETNYLDKVVLYTADVPDHKNIFAEIPKMEGAYQPPWVMLHTVNKALSSPLSITHVNTGADVSAKLAADDNDPLVLNDDQNLFDYQTLELDLGDIAGAPKVKLVINAISDFPNTPEGQSRMKLFTAHTKLEVLDANGDWVLVPADNAFLAKPKEFRRTHLVDISNAFVTDVYKIRLTYLFKTYIDSIFFDTTEDEPITLQEVPLASADLQYYGFSLKTEENGVTEYHYGDKVEKNMPIMPGNYTRYGDVSSLLGGNDDKFVIFGNGDEIQLKFANIALKPEATTRRYLLYMNGYYKNWKGDTISFTVEPMPFAEMSNFPYPETEAYPEDADHNEYRQEFNTRVQ